MLSFIENIAAYLIYIIFDKDLYIDTDKSGIVPVGDAEQLTLLQSDLQTMSADGYFYTYVTNLAQTKVYYNNFTVHHMRGNIRQINDYYPYGLIWSRPEGDDARMYQSKQWQQNEWGEGHGLEMYDFHAHMYDPVLARWHAPDPMNQFDSPYNAMGNNPVMNIDPDGMQVPWAGILSTLSRIQITETVKHCTNAARMTFENINVSKNLFGQLAGVMDVAGGLLAFGEGAMILSEGLKTAGQEASVIYDLQNGKLISANVGIGPGIKTPVYTVDTSADNYDPKNPMASAIALKYTLPTGGETDIFTGALLREGHPKRNIGWRRGDQVYFEDLHDMTSEFNALLIVSIKIFKKLSEVKNETVKNILFKELVETGAPYDLKSLTETDGTPSYAASRIGEWTIYNGQIMGNDDYGNFSYGYLGHVAGFKVEHLVKMASVAQLASTGSTDPIRDILLILQGFGAY